MKKKLKKLLSRIANSNSLLKYIYVVLWNGRKIRRYKRKYKDKYPVDPQMVVFESFLGRQYSCSPRALYEKLRDDPQYQSYKKVWAFKHPDNYRYLEEDPNTFLVKYRSASYYEAFARAGFWISNFRLANELQPEENQIYLQTWHGTPLKRLGYDIENYKGSRFAQKELEYQYSTDVKRYGYLLAPSPFYKEKMISAFDLKKFGKDDIFIECCYPRNDFLFHLTDSIIDTLKKDLGISPDKKVILYAPTWREVDHKPGEGYVYQLAVDFEKWHRQLGDDVIILFRTHYLIKNYIDLTKYEDFVINVSEYDDIKDLYAISDVLITDYSSVFFDYANLNRPILFFMYDYEKYVNEMRGFYIKEEELPGPIIKEEDELLSVLKNYDGSAYQEVYKKFNET